jgi:8-oxo-dGTP pyrophosphatase MutT (NUDIX family)
MEPHEAPVTTAVRETWEETGLEVRSVQLVDVYTRPASATNGPHLMVVVVYWCEVTGGTLQCSPEGLDLRYWPLAEVPAWHGQHRQYALDGAALWQARAAKD